MDFFAKQKTAQLIKRLPIKDPERSEWLMEHGECEESKKLRMGRVLRDTGTSLDEKVELLYNLMNPNLIGIDTCSPQAPQPYYPQAPQPQKPSTKNRW